MSDVTNIEELEEALDELFPGGYSIETDKRGQIVIHTGLVESEDGELVRFDDEESDEYDADTDPLEDEDTDDEE